MTDEFAFLPGLEKKPRRKATVVDVAAVAVEVDTPANHLAGVYDYAVTNKWQEHAQPGARVRVRYNGQLTDGYIVSEKKPLPKQQQLVRIERVIGDVPPLTAHIHQVAEQLSTTYAGRTLDILRHAIPPRHAAAEKQFLVETGVPPLDAPGADADRARTGRPPRSRLWPAYSAGEAYLDRLYHGGDPWAAVSAPPGLAHTTATSVQTSQVHKTQNSSDNSGSANSSSDNSSSDNSGTERTTEDSAHGAHVVPWWAVAIADAAAETVAGGRQAVVIVPDARDLIVAEAALRDTTLSEVAVLHTDLGPQQRYRAFLAALTGRASVVIGTRSAIWAPVPNLGLIAIWNEGDDQLRDPKAPYISVDSVARARARAANAALMYCHYVPSVTTAGLVETGQMVPVSVETTLRRRTLPRLVVTDEGSDRDPFRGTHRLPEQVTQHIRKNLGNKPALIHVPRTGSTPLLQCGSCGARAHCRSCGHVLEQRTPHEPPECSDCGAMYASWSCTACASNKLKATILGIERTASDFGRLFPGKPIRMMTGQHPLMSWTPPNHSIALATPGAQPWTPEGYATSVLLDPWLSTNQPNVDADQKSLRHWCDVIAATTGNSIDRRNSATVFIAGSAPEELITALRTWSFDHWAQQQWHQRHELHMAPAALQATLTGPRAEVMAFVAELQLPDNIMQLGPVQVRSDPGQQTLLDDGDEVQLLLREPATTTPILPATLRATSKRLSAARRRVPKHRLDPGLWLAPRQNMAWGHYD